MGKHRLSLLFAVITAIAIGVATTIINDVMGELASIASEVAPQVDEARSAALWTILATFGALFLLFLGFVAMADVTIYRSRKRELAAMEEAKPESTEGGRRVSVLRRQEGAPVLLG